MFNLFASIRKWFLLGLLILICFSFFYFHFYQYLTLNEVKKYQETVEFWTLGHYKSAVTLYLLIYIAMIACAIPGATLLTLIGGFLFGGIAVIYAILGTTLGGMTLFLAIRTTIGNRIADKSSGWIKKMEHGFQQNAFSYILTLRLIPIFPCWISNIAAGALNVPFKTYLCATVLGIFPATFIYVMVGCGLDKFLANENRSYLDIISTPSILFPLLGLALLSLFPVIYMNVKKRFQNR